MPSLRPVRAVTTGSNNAASRNTLRVSAVTPLMLAAHDAADRLDLIVVGDHHHARLQLVFEAVERQHLLARPRHAHGGIARHLVGVEHVQRPVEVVGHQVGDVDQRRDRAQADRDQPLLQPLRAGAVLHVAEVAADRERAGVPDIGALPFQRRLEGALDRRLLERLQRAEAGGRQVARDAVHAEAVGAVRRQLDLEHRVVIAHVGGEALAHRRIGREVDDAVMVLAQAHLAHRAQHAVGVDAADHALLEVELGAGDEAADRREHALHAGARVGRAAHHLHDTLAGIDLADAQLVGVRVLHRFDHIADGEGRQVLGAVLDMLDLEPDHGEGARDRLDIRIGVEMLLQPLQRELHRVSPPVIEGTSSGTNP